MRPKHLLLLMAILYLALQSTAQEATQKELSSGEKYTIENCINKFSMDKTTKTAVGYQYWFVNQNLQKII